MKVHQIQVGNMQNFSYIVEDENTSEAIVIDPSWDLIELELIIKRNNLKIKYIVNTHHHFDHTLGNQAMAESTGAPIVQHEASELDNDVITVKGWRHYKIWKFRITSLFILQDIPKIASALIGDGKDLSQVILLFVGNCGRVDLPGGSAKELYHSLFDILYTLG